MKLIASQHLNNENSQSKLAFTTTGGGSWPVWHRYISFNDEQIFSIGNICDTCEFFFRRMTDNKVSSFEIDHIRDRLAKGLHAIDDIAMALTEIIPTGNYMAALFQAQPNQSGTDHTPDYFSHEQRLAWEDYRDNPTVDSSYFRGGSWAIADQQMLFEFFIPLYDLKHLNEQRVEHYKSVLESDVQPTAVSVGVLDIKSSMTYPEDENGREIKPEYGTHWCFANYLIDGHHKVAASNATGKPITLLSFINLDHSWRCVEELINEYQSKT